MISLKTHNVLDYVIGVVLCAIPSVFGFSDLAAARNVYLVLGLGLIAYSACTRYYYSAIRAIPVGVHMGLDVLTGLILMGAPWVFGYSTMITGGQLATHFVMGLGAIAFVAVTRFDTRDRLGMPIATEERDNVVEIKRAA